MCQDRRGRQDCAGTCQDSRDGRDGPDSAGTSQDRQDRARTAPGPRQDCAGPRPDAPPGRPRDSAGTPQDFTQDRQASNPPLGPLVKTHFPGIFCG